MNRELLTIKIADICIGIKPLNEGFDEFCREYIVDEDPDFTVNACGSDLKEEQKRIADQVNGKKLSDLELEKIWVYRQIAETIPEYDAFLIHATSVCVDEYAYLFLGQSGAGKTTHAKLWREHFGDRFSVINDDKPIIKVTDGKILICGSPWCGKEDWKSNISAPLKGMADMNQSDENRIERLSRSDAWNIMMKQVYRSSEPETMQSILRLTDETIRRVPLYAMDCTRNEESVTVAYGTMSGEEL